MTDNLIHPYLVTAPLMIDSAPSVDINTIFIFDYKNSFKDSNSKPFEMMKYLESFNGTFGYVELDKKFSCTLCVNNQGKNNGECVWYFLEHNKLGG